MTEPRDDLFHDWDGEINALHGENLWDTPNSNSRHIRSLVIKEREVVRDKIKALPWWIRLFNRF